MGSFKGSLRIVFEGFFKGLGYRDLKTEGFFKGFGFKDVKADFDGRCLFR